MLFFSSSKVLPIKNYFNDLLDDAQISARLCLSEFKMRLISRLPPLAIEKLEKHLSHFTMLSVFVLLMNGYSFTKSSLKQHFLF